MTVKYFLTSFDATPPQYGSAFTRLDAWKQRMRTTTPLALSRNDGRRDADGRFSVFTVGGGGRYCHVPLTVPTRVFFKIRMACQCTRSLSRVTKLNAPASPLAPRRLTVAARRRSAKRRGLVKLTRAKLTVAASAPRSTRAGAASDVAADGSSG